MINVTKTFPAPSSLKSFVNYRAHDVITQLTNDFNNKCYICEDLGPSTLNVEHFKPHRGDKQKMFDWSNLFLCCGHCNNTKGHKIEFDDILNCTDNNDKITDLIKFNTSLWPFEKPQFYAQVNDIRVHNTVELLQQVYNGTTALKTIEGDNIRERLIDEMITFLKRVNKYFLKDNTQKQQEKITDQIRRMLSPRSQFTAFKIWVIKDNPRLMKEFGKYLP